VDFGARIYDSRLGSFLSTDPLFSKNPGISPYVFCLNNPLIYTDPDGKDAIISIKGNVITVSTTIFIFGKDATASAASSIQQTITNSWAKQSNGKDWQYTDPTTKQIYTVQLDVSVQLYEGKANQSPLIIPDAWNPSSRNNYIEVDNSTSRDYVRGGDEGAWTVKKWVPAHEWGHLVGLDDRYTDPPNGGSSIPNAGWKGNIMGSFYGIVEQRNIDAIVGDAVKDLNTKTTEAINSNKSSDYLLKSGSRFVPAKKPVPNVDYDYKFEIDSSDNTN
jgi:hypothetical protein